LDYFSFFEKRGNMEIHPPSGPIHSFKDFLLHLLTITIGVLIALGLDGFVERRHHKHLVHEATSNLTMEIRKNREALESGIKRMEITQAQLLAALGAVRKLLSDRGANTGDLSMSVSIIALRSTAWSTAAGTGALGHMKYGDLERYTRIYDLQQQFMAVHQRALDSMLELESWGVLLQGDRKRVSDAQGVDAERAVGRALAATRTAEDVGKALDAGYAGFLGGK
jgi:hypothetical protein